MQQRSLFDEPVAPAPAPRPPATAAQRRDRALAKVAGNAPDDFVERALAVVELLRGQEVTGEQLRLFISARGVVPHHHNAWGAVTMTGLRRGLLNPTGRYEPMTGPASHARKTAVYEVTE